MNPIVIIGAGPSGLLMAIELLHYGLACRLVDKAAAPSDKSKAIAIQARTLEILESMGLLDTCLSQGLKLHHATPMSQGRQLADLSFSSIPSPHPFVLSLEQNKFEAILIEYLEKLGGHVERQVELVSFQQQEQNVLLFLKNLQTDQIESLETPWLIGCDGAHSFVRKELNLSFEGNSFPQIFSLADLEIKWKYPRDCLVGFLEKTGVLFAIPLQENNRYRLIFQLARDQALLKENQSIRHGEIPATLLEKPTLEEATAIVHQYADQNARLTNPVWMTNFSINSRMVSRYQKHRVFLVGDAAHIHSPAGGQGMNTGLQDAFNLAWKLWLVQKGLAHDSLIESYNKERHFVGERLLTGTERATHLILKRSPLFFYMRNAFISFVTSFPSIRHRLASIISQTDICYPKNKWIVQISDLSLNAKAGSRAPDASIMQNGTQTSLFSLWKHPRSFQLLLIDLKGKTSELKTLASDLGKQYGNLIKIHIVKAGESVQTEEIQDLQGEIKCLYGDSTVYLVRPDGYIGFCGPLAKIKPLKEYLSHLFI